MVLGLLFSYHGFPLSTFWNPFVLPFELYKKLPLMMGCPMPKIAQQSSAVIPPAAKQSCHMDCWHLCWLWKLHEEVVCAELELF